MVVTYYIKLFRTEADRYNGILMSLLFLVAETIIAIKTCYQRGFEIFTNLICKAIKKNHKMKDCIRSKQKEVLAMKI